MTAELEKRLVEVELSLTHLQHDFDKLNGVVLSQQSVIDDLYKELSRAHALIEALEEGPEIRDPEAERPPHH